MTDDPLFKRQGDHWMPTKFARGPFDGLQGGGVAALMCTHIERWGQVRGLQVASAATHFLKPVPTAPLSVSIKPVREGRRVSVVDAELYGAGGLLAVLRSTLIRPQEDELLPTPAPQHVQPEQFARHQRAAIHGQHWLMDAMEARPGPDGSHWFRLLHPITSDDGPVSRLLAAADWAHGINPPQGAAGHLPCAIPNPDLFVTIFRLPVSDWIGLNPATAWARQSIGSGWASLHDVTGQIGSVCMSVAVTRLAS